MADKPTTAAGYKSEQLELVRATCLYLATKLGDLMDERVLITDHMARWPPSRDIRVIGFRDQNRPKTLRGDWVSSGKEFQFVQPFEVERQTSLAPVDLKTIVVLAARREPSGLKGADGAVGEFDLHEGCVIDGHISHTLSGSGGKRMREDRSQYFWEGGKVDDDHHQPAQ